MSRTNLFLKVELEHEEDEKLERLAGEICRHIMKFYGVRSAELTNYTKMED